MKEVTIKIENYKILSTGADGGHHYISTKIKYNGVIRDLTILMSNKIEEGKLKENQSILLKGELQEEGDRFSLTLKNAIILSNV